jgi:hypothetical protein
VSATQEEELVFLIGLMFASLVIGWLLLAALVEFCGSVIDRP